MNIKRGETTLGRNKRNPNKGWFRCCFQTILALGISAFLFVHMKTIELANRSRNNKQQQKSHDPFQFLFEKAYNESHNHNTDMTTTSTGTSDEKQEVPATTMDTATNSPYAYTWIIGGIHEDRPSYKGFIWDVATSVNVLRKAGSKADFWLLVRLSPDSKQSTMPEEDLNLLTNMGVHVNHLEKPLTETFSQLMYDKFLILNMIQYKRILFLDADTLPMTNMDYLFHLSDPDNKDMPTLLKPFLIYATRGEPANGGMFMVEPSSELYQEYLKVIQKQHESAKTLPYPHFDRGIGWGYNFRKNNDQWEGIKKNGKRWDWWGAHVDQGLMYYISRLLQPKGVSIAIGPKVQNWVHPSSKQFEPQKPELESETMNLLEKYQPPLLAYQYNCDKGAVGDFSWQCHPPYNSFSHFVGTNKPWQKTFNFDLIKNKNRRVPTHGRQAAENLWYQELDEINTKYNMNLNLKQWNTEYLPKMKESALGYMPKYSDQTKVFEHIKSEQDKGSSQQQNEAERNTIEKPVTNEKKEESAKNNNQNKFDSNVVAYAISFIKCGDSQNGDSAGLIDASLVLRHSIHQISSRNPDSGSKYDYKMYALVHRQAEKCSSSLTDLGFEVKVVNPPILQSDIKGEYLRKNIHKERCCGADEFIKLFAYTLPHEIIVHVDMDVAFYKPMDHLFDAILYDKDSKEGTAARELIELERPSDKLPDKIGAFITRDWTQVNPGKWQPGYQAGFLIARYDESILPEVVEIIREGNYTYGWGNSYGWASKG